MTKVIVNNHTQGVIPNHRALAVVSQTMQQALNKPLQDSAIASLDNTIVRKNTPTEYTVEVHK